MIDALFSQPTYVATKKMLDLTALRHEAISSNIANLETPGYKRIDVEASFNDELTRAVATGDASAIGKLQPKLGLDATATGVGRDGNTVQLENELLELNQNSVAHTVETQLVSGNLMKLRMAITGKPV
jgi:flagellar basal-body rod protein FlgB